MGSKAPYWIKFSYDRDTYLVDLSCINTFVCAPNGKITFWLPDSGNPIVLTPQAHSDAYQTVLNYIEMATGYTFL